MAIKVILIIVIVMIIIISFFLLTPCSSIALNIHEYGTASKVFWQSIHAIAMLVILFLLSENTVLSTNNCSFFPRLPDFTPLFCCYEYVAFQVSGNPIGNDS